MARITIEDCVDKISSHFKVVQVASHRAHQLELGAKPLVEKEGDKPVVIALREIAAGKIDETVLSKPLATKDPWEQDEGLLIQSDDIGPLVADTDSYNDINEVEAEDAKPQQGDDSTSQSDAVAAQPKLDSEDGESKTDGT